MPVRYFPYLFLPVLLFFACRKDPSVDPPPADPLFTLHVNNEYSPIQTRFAIFLSDESGRVKVYSEIPGNDTTLVTVPVSKPGDRFDCTVVNIVTIDAPGSGVRDTIVHLTTYTNLASGETINLRSPYYYQTTDLLVTFTGVTSVDSIIVPDGLTFARPQASNNFSGQYRVLHTGKLWMRVQVNGQPTWRFILFENVDGPTLSVTVDANLMLPLFAMPKNIALPFTAAWEYKVDGVVDTAGFRFLAMGDLLRAPGGAIPVFNDIDVFEPISNDIFNPGPKPYNGFRVQLNGSDPSPGGNILDRFFAGIPATVPQPAFDLQPTVLSDNRLVATQCIGSFDALVFSRTRSGTPHITWDVYLPPSGSIASYRLPDVPQTLGGQFPSLKIYDFGGQVRVRAEDYETIMPYDVIVRRRLRNDDLLWQAKAGYLAKEKVF
ncbi:MAG: hypothetical protein IPJ82_06475 [Lewinellaceae bacterium]|nr:hypothetical protein [Lewinellaceae bacterium]